MTKAKEKLNDNMKIWNQVCTTDPAITKQVNQRGGFTAICAQAQLKRATELWGAYGGKWGVKNLVWGTIGKDGDLPAEITLDAVFYCPDIEFEISSCTQYRAGNDTRKKLLTDLTTKSLSKLGFNSDIFEGKFDDNKYLAEQKAKHAQKVEDESGGFISSKQRQLLCDKMMERNMEAETLAAIVYKACGAESSKEIPRDKFDGILQQVLNFEAEPLPLEV